MIYEIRHRTTYEYEHDVSLSHHIARLTPRDRPHQRCQDHHLETVPKSTTQNTHADHFGNTVAFLTIEGPHRRLDITSFAVVEIGPPPNVRPDETTPWKEIREAFAEDAGGAPIEPAEFVFPSPLVPLRAEFADFARESFPSDAPILACALDLTGRIHRHFKFDARATTVTTPVMEFFRTRRGVCQDFAQFMIACLRSMGLPARYVSGYLETLPPPGRPRLVGADASHAWVSLWCGDQGWVDLDPTNNLVPGDRHVTIAWGRDFSDVSPIRGVMVGSGSHSLSVAVDMAPRAR